jgi:hypothetical protein
LQSALVRLGERDPAVLVRIRLQEVAGEKAAATLAPALAARAAALGPRFTPLGAVAALRTFAVLELLAAEFAVAIVVEARKGLGAALGALRPALPPKGLALRLHFGLGKETVAIGVQAGELGLDLGLNGGAGERLAHLLMPALLVLGMLLALLMLAMILGGSAGGREGGNGRAQKNDLFHMLEAPKERRAAFRPVAKVPINLALYRP